MARDDADVAAGDDPPVLKRSIGEWAWDMRAVTFLFMALPPEMESAYLLGGKGELYLWRNSPDDDWLLKFKLAGRAAVYTFDVGSCVEVVDQLARKLGYNRHATVRLADDVGGAVLSKTWWSPTWEFR